MTVLHRHADSVLSRVSWEARVIASVLLCDATLHVYWALGLTWPAPNVWALSNAMLGFPVPFTPPILLPLIAILVAGCGLVLARSVLGREHRFGWLLQSGTVALTIGFTLRGVLGIVWVFGIGVQAGLAFFWLNLLLDTPLCLFLAVLSWRVTERGAAGRSWPRRILIAAPVVAAVLLSAVAYAWWPSAATGYRPAVQYQAGSHFVETPLAKFHYLHAGTGPDVVLLAPGSAWTFAWQQEFEALVADHSVYVVDLPGQGYTTLHDPGFGYTLEDMTGAIGVFLDAVHVRSTVLAGNSWSGGWALGYAQQHPHRISRLMLLAPSGLDRPDILSWEAMKVPVLGELYAKLGYGSKAMVESGASDLVVHQNRLTPAEVNAFWAPNTWPGNLRSVYLLERGLDWSQTQDRMPRTRQSTLIIWGAHDAVLPVEQASVFGRLLPHASVHVLAQCGHALTIDCPTQVTTLMEDFLHGR
ncbi:MAG TPA: alpha/beta fold hydrolase [Microbacteriaceae bacterium]